MKWRVAVVVELDATNADDAFTQADDWVSMCEDWPEEWTYYGVITTKFDVSAHQLGPMKEDDE